MNLKTISCKDDFLSGLIEQLPASHVVDACTRKCLMANDGEVTWNGLESAEDLIGITLSEFWIEGILNKKDKLNLNSAVISNRKNNFEIIRKSEDQLLLNKCRTSFNCIYIDFNGFISFEKTIKLPISGHNNKIVAFLTASYDLTSQFSFDELLRQYQKYYPNKEAIQRILEHLGVDSYFNSCDLPTCMEMRILLSMREGSRCKAVAHKFGLSVPTASNHITNIQHKLKSSDLHNVLRKLRAIPVHQQGLMDSGLLL